MWRIKMIAHKFRRTVLPLLILIVIGLGWPSYAQTEEKEVYVGIKAGISMPNLVSGDEEEITRDYKSRLALNVGVLAEFQVTKGFSIQTGIDYAPQGGKREGIQPITSPLPGLPPPPGGLYYYADFKNTAKLYYLEAPLLAKYSWRRQSKVQPYVNAGTYVGILMKAKTVTRGSSTIYIDRDGTPLLLPPDNQPLPPISFDADTNVTEDLNRFNIGVTGGGGLKFRVKRDYFFVDLRGSYGLRTIQKEILTSGESHTGNLVISVGYAFRVR
jgi:hypothetical protein